MSKFHIGMGDALGFVVWVQHMHPEVFKEWKSVIEIERSVDPDWVKESEEEDGI